MKYTMLSKLVAFLVLSDAAQGSVLLPTARSALSARAMFEGGPTTAPLTNHRQHPRHHQMGLKNTPSTRNARERSSTRCAFVDTFSIGSALCSFAKTSPYATAFLTSALKGVAADWLAQSSETKKKMELAASRSAFRSQPSPRYAASVTRGGSRMVVLERQPRPPYDFKRTLAFMLYGGIYQGLALELIYNKWFSALFGQNVILKVLTSQFLMAPLLTLPIAYVMKGLVYGQSFGASVNDYWKDVSQKGLLLTFWKIWIPIQCIVFGLVPPHLRISFSAAISFAWTILFSRISSEEQ